MRVPIRMKNEPKIEPFAEFAEQGYQVPTLMMWSWPKTASVEWREGRVWGSIMWPGFQSEIERSGMNAEVTAIWQYHRPQLLKGRRAEYHFGGCCGGVYHVPHAMAIKMYHVVLDHFTRALRVLVDNMDDTRRAYEPMSEARAREIRNSVWKL